ncbi:SPOR domain-containing protein [Sphingomonas sp. TREG-RG-20F-R18-01]|uniref:SPOR domain-containing protein n=1 Tax=Sphingomonas sp. TREG-RG-20F-R18-01 TaxID=2914982 RepID=UPI001F58A5E9|nr:SPOR domain-containing protein [Sphingomonas sp. TREG-RG-20F-R18-01]
MTVRSALSVGPVTLGLSVLLLSGVAATVTSSIAGASARDQSKAERHARREIAKARTALSRKNVTAAIAHAEMAVADQPDAVEYRLTLGQSYLKAGRFVSARDAFADALALEPTNGKAALHLALMQIGTGDWAGARTTLDAHASVIPISDRGLAMALAGDPVAAVELLGPAARSPDADAKVRQNLALSLALAGRWREAQSVVAIDLAPTDVPRRLLEWSTFSRPTSASDQISSLLGVIPVVDSGQPQRLALNRSGIAPAMAATAVDATAVDARVAAPTAVVPSVATNDGAVGPAIAGVVFAPQREVVQALPAPLLAAAKPRRDMARMEASRQGPPAMPARAAVRGNFYVQLGAYDTAAVAHDAWMRAAHRFAALSGHVPQGMGVTAGGATFYRLSVGGLAREDAVSLCRGYRARGGACFVRASAGDQIAQWARGRELAAR